jgi:Transposase and inactivated derivatives
MANTYSQIYLHLVFATKPYPISYIKEDQRVIVEKYICGIVRNNDCKMLAIYCNPDHTHIFLDIAPKISISELVQKIKVSSSKFIHEHFKNRYFAWQSGYGVFSSPQSAKEKICRYILNQKEHHGKRNFRDEYLYILDRCNIEYKEEYIFK